MKLKINIVIVFCFEYTKYYTIYAKIILLQGTSLTVFTCQSQQIKAILWRLFICVNKQDLTKLDEIIYLPNVIFI